MRGAGNQELQVLQISLKLERDPNNNTWNWSIVPFKLKRLFKRINPHEQQRCLRDSILARVSFRNL